MTTRYAKVHKNPQGPGDARPTALQIIQDEGLENELPDKAIFITGVSSGIGVETAKALAATGATLFLAARNLSKAREQLGDLADSPRVHLMELDLSSLSSVRKCACRFFEITDKLHIFIANAGIMATPEGRTEDGFETQFATNYLSHFLLFILLQPALLTGAKTSSTSSRAIFLSSTAHRYSPVLFDNYNFEGIYDPWLAYGQSKSALIWAANEIDRRYAAQGIRAFSVQPGGIVTGLGQYLPKEEAEKMASNVELGPQWKSPAQGASTTVWGAVAQALEGVGGKYLEDAQIGWPYDPAEGVWVPGYAEHAFDPEAEGRLWDLSLKLVGLDGEENA
ncbi:short-chain dehydrogenase [Aspergillus desertorum]